jgi:hypothetical protein
MKASEFIVERKKRKRRSQGAAYGPGPYGGYGYYAGYSGDSGEGGGDGGGGGESIENEDAMMAKIENDGKIVRILKKQHSVPFSDEKNWLLIDTDPAKGNKGLGLKWVPASTRFTWVRPYKETMESSVAEGKITLSTDPNWYGATVDNYQASGPVVNIPANQLVGFEPDDKMNQPKSKANVEKIVAGLKQGAKLPPLLIRKYKNGYQVLDGHHRFWAYKLLGVKSIPAQIVPDSDIEEISKQGVAENFADGKNPQDKGDSKRHGINTKASVSSLRKTAKQGGRKGQLAHWLANMKAGRAKKNK